MNYPSHIADRPSATIQNFTIHETSLIGRNKEFDALLTVLGTATDQIVRRNSVDLLDLAHWLPRICLHDFVTDDTGQLVDAIVRFQGPEIGASYSEITGKSIFTHPEPAVVDMTLQAMKRIIKLKRPLTSSATGMMENKPDLLFQSLYIPLSSNGKDIIGSLIYATIEPSKT